MIWLVYYNNSNFVRKSDIFDFAPTLPQSSNKLLCCWHGRQPVVTGVWWAACVWQEAVPCEIERGQSGAAIRAKTLIWFSCMTQHPGKQCSFNQSQQSCVLFDDLTLLFDSWDAALHLNVFVTLQPAGFNEILL